MITLDALARSLGCTLSDIDDLAVLAAPAEPDRIVPDIHARTIAAEWSKRTGIDYTETVK